MDPFVAPLKFDDSECFTTAPTLVMKALKYGQGSSPAAVNPAVTDIDLMIEVFLVVVTTLWRNG